MTAGMGARLRIFRQGRSYDLPKTAVRRVVTCGPLVAIGDRGGYTGLLEGLPALLVEPLTMQSVRIDRGGGRRDGFPSARFAVIIGESADMPFALVADQVDALPDQTAADTVMSAEDLQAVLCNSLKPESL